MYMYGYVHVMDAYRYICIHVCICINMCVCICMYVCMFVCIYACVCVGIYILYIYVYVTIISFVFYIEHLYKEPIPLTHCSSISITAL